ncbi:MAG TPA: TIGR04282 family arsenosugar biosynthesis glycosyltransferase [Vicinamibacteria bacterium]|nr:TIGR04282 family arsenosugar biosynthesis glycosyltransferase [Vicinamibacteria bacterium]
MGRASDRVLVVFVRLPRPGAVKTRLAAAIGPEAAAGLYRALAERVLEATTPAGEYERLVFFDPPEALAEMRAWLPGVRLLAQRGGDLGERMSDAFSRAFARGAGRVAIVGTDALGISQETVTEALSALDEAEVVIGPTEDGGYCLVALRAPRPELFSGIAWSTPTVAAETRARAREAGLAVRELAHRRDIDTVDDLRAEWPAVRAVLVRQPALLDTLARVVGGLPRSGVR